MFSAEAIADALTTAGIPVSLQGEFIRFQLLYGGRQDTLGLNGVTWGILHRNPLWMPSDRVEAEFDASSGNWDVVCADVHPSDTVSVDEVGRLYWSGLVRFSHYDDYFAGHDPLPFSTA